MKKNNLIKLFITLFLVFSFYVSPSWALDPPHGNVKGTIPGLQAMYCPDCHKIAVDNIPDLCLTCHTSGGRAGEKALSRGEQAELGITGTTHRFDSEGLKYVKKRIVNDSKGLLKVSAPKIQGKAYAEPSSAYTGDYDTQNEMEYEIKIVTGGAVGTATFKYKWRIRSKADVDTNGAWNPDAGWSSNWADNSGSGYGTTGSTGTAGVEISLYHPADDGLTFNPKVLLTFEDGGSGTSFEADSTYRLYIKKIADRYTGIATTPYQEMKSRMFDRGDGIEVINCSVCHNQHLHRQDRPYLRASNQGNALCKYCHDDRDKGHYVLFSGQVTTGGLTYIEDTNNSWTEYTGTATGGTTTTVVDTTREWKTDEYKGQKVIVLGETKSISSNTATTLTLNSSLSSAVVNSSGYKIYKDLNNKLIYFQKNFGGLNDSDCTTGDYAGNSAQQYDANEYANNIVTIECTELGDTYYDGFYRRITSNDEKTIYWSATDTPGDEFDGALKEAIDVDIKYKVVDPKNVGSHPVGVVFNKQDFEERFNTTITGLVLDDAGTPDDSSDDTVECMTCHSPHFAHSISTDGGNASGGSTTTLVDKSQGWSANSLVNQEMRILNEYRTVLFQGVATAAATAESLTDTNASWAVDELKDKMIKIVNLDEKKTITANTTTTVSWTGKGSLAISINNRYVIFDPPIKGTATGEDASWDTGESLQDTSQNWAANSLVDKEVEIASSIFGTTKTRIIASNSSNTMYWDIKLGAAIVGAGDSYKVRARNENWRRKRTVTSNTSDTITWSAASPLGAAVTVGDQYEIVDVTSNSGKGGGYLLDKKPDETLCETCHAYKDHFGAGGMGGTDKTCRSCHTPHNTSNRFLIREVVNNRIVSLLPGGNYVRADRKGICQVCHTAADHWRNDGTDPIAHYTNGCPECHNHADTGGSWKFRCHTCHGVPPVPVGTKFDDSGNIVGKDGKIGEKDNATKKYTGRRIPPVGNVTEYIVPNEEIPNTTYRVESYASYIDASGNLTVTDTGAAGINDDIAKVFSLKNGYSMGGAHLVHVVGKLDVLSEGTMEVTATCIKCHGHDGYGKRHGGSVGRKIPKRFYATFDFDLDFKFNTATFPDSVDPSILGYPMKDHTYLGYHDIVIAGFGGTFSIANPVYPAFIQGSNESTSGTSTISRVKSGIDFGPAGKGPGPVDLGEVFQGIYDYDDTVNSWNGYDSATYLSAPNPTDPGKCRVGCHNPRRLYKWTEEPSDLATAENKFANIFSWAWFFPDPSDSIESGFVRDPSDTTNYDYGYYGNLPRDEIADVPCTMCHDSQGLLIQGTFEDLVPDNIDQYGLETTHKCAVQCHGSAAAPVSGERVKYRGLEYISSHPADHNRRTDCLKCHDYWNLTSQMTGGYPYLNQEDDKDCDTATPDVKDDCLFIDEAGKENSLEPFCMSCHDAGGRTRTDFVTSFDGDGKSLGNQMPNAGGTRNPFKSYITLDDIKVYWSSSAHSGNITCFGDGTSTGCHNNPHGSTRFAILAPYNQDVSQLKYFCFNCHGNQPRIRRAPNIRDQIEKRNTPGGSGHPLPNPGDPLYHRRIEPTIAAIRHNECVDCHDPMSDNKENRLKGQRYLDISGNPWDPGKDRVVGR